MPAVDFEASWDFFERRERLEWLQLAVARSATLGTSDHDLLAALRCAFDVPQRSQMLAEFERRLSTWPAGRHRRVAGTLSRLHDEHVDPGRAAQRVDRLLMRLLCQVRGVGARRLANECLRSSRITRRRAALRFFELNGLDPTSGAAVVEMEPSSDYHYLSLVRSDPDLMRAVGFQRIMDVTDSFFWRAQAIEVALTIDAAAVELLGEDYPAETIFALHRAQARDQEDLIWSLSRAHGDDLDVLACAIRCLGEFGATERLQVVVDQAEQVLSREIPLFFPEQELSPAGPAALTRP